jgi:outer membrane lipoprotein-sorting protein
MKNIFKTVFILIVTSTIASSCVKDDDFVIPSLPPDPILSNIDETFEEHSAGSGSNEVNVSLRNWLNVNFSGNDRLWNVKEYNNNKYAEFSSFYSSSSDNDDDTWLITPPLHLNLTENTEVFSFDTQTRYANGAVLKALISTDFDGTEEGINSATWVELNPTLPTADQIWVNSGNIDLATYENDVVYIAFRYTGSKQGGTTTTFQIDNIKVQ